MNRYDSYKDSGVEWIGKIPSHWDFVRLKYLFSLEGGKDPKNIQNDEGEYPILGTGGEISRGSDYLYDKPTLLLGRKGTIDKPYLYESPFWVSDVMYYTIMKKDITPKYLHFLFKTIPFDYYRYGSTQPSMSRLDYESMYFPIPPSDERQEVSNYLDTKTSLIDSLIEKTKQKIELLKEKRTSLINEVVTKGLNPNVEMKDSGMEWIGDIPSHWIMSKFKFDTLSPVQYGINISSDKYIDEGIRFVRITDINEDGSLKPDNGKYLLSENVPEEFLLNKYDVLFCRSGGTVGKSYLHISEGQFTSGGYLVRFNFRNYNESKFIFYLSKTHFYWDWIKLNTVVSTIENVNGDKYQNFIYPKPSTSEQQQIVEYLDEQTQLIDKTISIEEKRIELLKEYRQSLISEVVTGKRKVV